MGLSGDAQQTREYAPPEALLGRCAVASITTPLSVNTLLNEPRSAPTLFMSVNSC